MIRMRWQWWQSLSAMADAVTALPKTSAHMPVPTFVVTIAGLLSYLLETSWKMRSAPRLPVCRQPSSPSIGSDRCGQERILRSSWPLSAARGVLDGMLAADEARQPAVPHGLHAERDREMGLAHARAPDGYHVLVPVHEAERGEVLDLRPGHARLEGPAGVLERLRAGEARLPCLAADDALAPEPRLVGGHPG